MRSGMFESADGAPAGRCARSVDGSTGVFAELVGHFFQERFCSLRSLGTQDHDHQIGLVQPLHEVGNRVAVFDRGHVAKHVPMLIFQCLAQTFDHFLTLAIFFGGAMDEVSPQA
jgi:hypothetical protein